MCFPKAKDKWEKVWHINTSWISEDKNRFWLYFSKIEVTVVWWQAESPSLNFFSVSYFSLFFFSKWTDRFLFLIHRTHWVSDSIFRFWSLWPRDQGLAPAFRPPCPNGGNITDNAIKESNLLKLVTSELKVNLFQEGHVFLWLLQFIAVGVGSRIAPWPLQAQGTIGQGAEWYLAFSNFDNFSFCSVFLRNSEEKFIRMPHSSQGFSWVLKGHLGSGT